MIPLQQSLIAGYASGLRGLPGIDTIVLVGASIEYALYNTYLTVLAEYMQVTHGLTVTIVGYGWSGATVDTIYDNYMSAVEPYLISRADGGAGCLIITMPTGNDVTTLQPWSGASTVTLNAREAKLEQLITAMKARVGNDHVILLDNTFRLYGYPATDCLVNEDLGAKKFNEEWMDDVIKRLLPQYMYQNQSVGNPYNFAFNWWSLVLTDSTHYVASAYQILARWWMDLAAAIIKGALPPYIPKKTNPLTDQKPKSGRVILVYRNTAVLQARSSNSAYPAVRATPTGAVSYLCPVSGYDPVLGLEERPMLTGITTVSGLGSGDNSISIYNDKWRDNFVYTNSQRFVLLEVFTNLLPFQKARVRLLCMRNVGAGITRWQEFSADGVNVIGEIDSGYTFANNPTPPVFDYVFTADAAGRLPIYMRCKAGNVTGAYCSAIEVDPQPMPVPWVYFMDIPLESETGTPLTAEDGTTLLMAG